MIKDFYEKNENLSKAMGIFLGLGTIGYAIGPYLSTYFLQTFGDANYLYIMIFGILTAIFMLFYHKNLYFSSDLQNLPQISTPLLNILDNRRCCILKKTEWQ